MTETLDARVLFLNSNYEPINIITLKKAIKKLINAKAEVISVESGAYVSYDINSWLELTMLKKECGLDADENLFGSDSFSIVIPTVIRSLTYDKAYRQSIRMTRRNIFVRDKNICQFCGKKFPTDKLTLDHVLPRAQGGISTWENLVCACRKCNQKKGCMTLKESGMKLLSIPVKPSIFTTFELPKGTPKYKNWDSFVSDIYWSATLEE